uniref:ISY1 splicing factor homolog n=1 Tax=Ursus maritimus TaxID=29073 RepID=A0A452UIJ3_URSMA
MEKLALKCWIMKGKKSQEIEVTNTLELLKICLVSESFLKKNSGLDWLKSGKQRERPGWQEEKRRRRRKRRKRSTYMLSPRRSLTRKAARRKEVKTGSRSSLPTSQCRPSKRSRRHSCGGRRWNSSRSMLVRPCRPRAKRPEDFWAIRAKLRPAQGLDICLETIIPCWPLLQIWDTAGQERFRTITQSYYRSANGAILAYDITKRSSFLSVPHWIEDVRKYAGSNIVQLLIGNKSDLGELREVPLAEAQSLAEHYDILCAIETSAKDSSNVEEAFVRVATELVVRHGGPLLSEKGTDHIQLDSKDVGDGWGCGC